MSELAGQVLSHYQFQQAVGTGAAATVYHATDTRTGEPVAIKCLKAQHTTGAAHHLERFQRESDLLRAMDHPNIVKLLDTFADNGQQFLVMEYVPGGTLREWLNQEPQLSLDRVLWIALDLADALTRAHRLDIIHRDLKPENVLLAEDGTPRLTDFGIAHLLGNSSLTHEGALIGTPRYLSPEAINQQDVDGRTDIWALGVMLFEMLAGVPPFEADLLTQLLAAILQQPPPDLETLRPDAPVALVDLVYRMLEKDRAARIPSVRLVGAELEALLRVENLVESILGNDLDRHTLDGSSVFATPTPADSAPRHNLPAQTTPFVGREDELAEIAGLLADPDVRLITILGPGGMGKTRLALETAAQQVGKFERGVWFVSLTPLSEPSGMVTAIAEAVGFQFYQSGGTQREQLLNYLRAKEMLLVLDNFEHLLDGADLVHDILRTAPDVKVLATSRAKLNLGAEVLFAISGIQFPGWETPEDALEYSAVKLFMQSARRVAAAFELGAEHLRYVARICRLVAGMPLGILLAAAWVDVLSPEEIADEIKHNLDFLASERRDLPERHRSMRAIFDSAWDRLGVEERDIFMRLAVFRGGFTRRAAQTVTGATLRQLTELVNKSLLRRIPESGRFEVHELLRQYAEEKLTQSGMADDVRDAHSLYYLDAVAVREADLKSKRVMQAVHEIGSDFENVNTAWHWALEREHFAAIASARARLGMAYFNLVRIEEGRAAFQAAVRALDTSTPEGERGVLLGAMLHTLVSFTANIDEGRTLAERSLAILRQLDGGVEMAWSLSTLAIFEQQSDVGAAKQLVDESVAIFTAVGDQFGQASALHQLGWILSVWSGDLEAAEPYFQRSLEINRQLGNPLRIANNIVGLAQLAHAQGEHREGQRLNLEALALFRSIGYRRGAWICLHNMGLNAHLTGDHERSKQLLEEALAISTELGIPGPDTQINLSFTLGALGDAVGARRCLREALDALLEQRDFVGMLEGIVSYARLLARYDQFERAVELVALALSKPGIESIGRKLTESFRDDLQAQLPPDVFAAAWARGQALDLDATVLEILDELEVDTNDPA